MKRIFTLFTVSVLMLSSCSQFDDTEIQASITSLESRLTALETAMNAYNNNLFIKSVSPIANGYTIEFSDGSKCSIVNGKDGKDGRTLVGSVAVGKDYVTFTLTDGSSFSLPRHEQLSITFNPEGLLSVAPNSEVDIPYTIKSAAENVTVEIAPSSDIKAKVIPNGKQGRIHIKTGHTIDEYSSIVVIVSDGYRTIVRSLKFRTARVDIFSMSINEVNVPADGGTFEVTVTSNIGYKINSMPSWVKETAKVQSGEGATHFFTVNANGSNSSRSGLIVFCNDNQVCIPVSVNQNGKSSSQNRNFIHKSLAMRFTADWCAFCPDMDEALHTADKKMDAGLEVVSIHMDGRLIFPLGSFFDSFYEISGYPTGIIDGRVKIQNDDTATSEAVKASQETANLYRTVSGISFKSSKSGNTLSADVELFLKEAETYKLTVWAVEDGIISPQTVGSEVDNYYEHNGVLRLALSSVGGETFTVAKANTTKQFSYRATIPSNCKADNMRLVVFVQRMYGARTPVRTDDYGAYYIDNSASGKIGTKVDYNYAN